MKRWTKADAGCYIDGSFGLDHQRFRLLDLVNSTPDTYGHPGHSAELAEACGALHGPMSDDNWETDVALEHLQHNTEDGLLWIFDSGDLLLTVGQSS